MAHPADEPKALLQESTEGLSNLEQRDWMIRALRVLLVGEVEQLCAKYPTERK